nr:hypothetical protein [Streptomyces sp. DSM 41633]
GAADPRDCSSIQGRFDRNLNLHGAGDTFAAEAIRHCKTRDGEVSEPSPHFVFELIHLLGGEVRLHGEATDAGRLYCAFGTPSCALLSAAVIRVSNIS